MVPFKNELLAMVYAGDLAITNNRIYYVGMHSVTREFHVMEEYPTEIAPYDLEGNGELVDCEVFINVVNVHP